MAQTNLVIDGECEMCGLPGIIGMTCAECHGTIVNFADPKPAAKSMETQDDRYADDLLDDDKVVSLESLAEDEVAVNPDDETL